ncbi:uncharacterized protein TNCV_4784291 [Trichonephila clavipes]|nr:uncharacterized protein TNCV_4784291 [Trichonephila clavipes]
MHCHLHPVIHNYNHVLALSWFSSRKSPEEQRMWAGARRRKFGRQIYESDDEYPSPKIARHEKTNILQDLHKGLTETDNDSINQELLDTQKQYFIMSMEKLMHQIPIGKAIIETVRKNGQKNNFMCMYTASKTIIQALMNVKQSKVIKSVVDMIFGGACRYVHETVISPMLNNVVHNEHLKRAYQVYQNSVKMEENDAELEIRCLLHCIYEVLEREEHCIKSFPSSNDSANESH